MSGVKFVLLSLQCGASRRGRGCTMTTMAFCETIQLSISTETVEMLQKALTASIRLILFPATHFCIVPGSLDVCIRSLV